VIGPRLAPGHARLPDEIRTTRPCSLDLLLKVPVIGDHIPAWMQQFLGTDAATLTALDSLTMLRGSVQEMAPPRP
jgi:hypothetical protein